MMILLHHWIWLTIIDNKNILESHDQRIFNKFINYSLFSPNWGSGCKGSINYFISKIVFMQTH